jgi:glycolate oxidase FAD binding subunit
MSVASPESPEQLAGLLAECAGGRRSVALGGAFTKQHMGGPAEPADVRISTAAMNRRLQYEPQDLTVSVEAGMRWGEFQRLLSEHRQMVPLDPPFFDAATVGGVVASNCSGPRRRLYGSARDAVIGMRFATLEGKLVETGGMVVKNVAGLDMGKLLIGSFGTLAAIATVNFKVSPVPPCSVTFVKSLPDLTGIIAVRDALLRGVLQPVAIDLLNPHAASRIGLEDWALVVQAAGNDKVVERWRRELSDWPAFDGEAEQSLWERVREFTPRFLADHAEGAVARVPVTLGELGALAGTVPVPLLARAGTGVCYAFFADCESASHWLHDAVNRNWTGVLEWIPARQCTSGEQWPRPGDDFETMRKIKAMFDPAGLLNRGRLYGRL